MNLFSCMLTACLLLCQATDAQTAAFSVYFTSGSHRLDAAATKTLDSLLYHDLIHTGQQLRITGYADEPGGTAFNRQLSMRRSRAVADYLVTQGFLTRSNIAGIAAEGSRDAGAGDNPGARRAEISVVRPDAVPEPVPAPVVEASPAKPEPPRVYIINGSTPAPAAPPAATSPSLMAGGGSVNVSAVLDTLQLNETVALSDLVFYGGSPMMVPEARPALEALLKAMNDRPTLEIRLEGHICCVKTDSVSPDYAQALSEERAKTVYTYLVANGIAPARLTYKGFGNSRPKFPAETTEAERSANRRVEARVMRK